MTAVQVRHRQEDDRGSGEKESYPRKDLKNELIEFFNTSKRGCKRKMSHMTSRFLAQATGKMDLPPTEMRTTTVGQDLGAKGGRGRSSDMLIKSIRHPAGNVQWAAGYSHLNFRGEVSAGERYSRIISISQRLDPAEDS